MEEYEERSVDDIEKEIKKESKSPISELKPTKAITNVNTTECNTTENDVDVKPDIKPFVSKLFTMDYSVIESLIAAVNER